MNRLAFFLSGLLAMSFVAGLIAFTVAVFAHAATKQLILPRVKGETYRAVTQATVPETVCVKGYTSTIRPPSAFTSTLKKWQLKDLGYADQNTSDFEEDHLIPLELGGAPFSSHNLWPEPHAQSAKSDPLENSLHSKLCAGTLTLKQARQQILQYKRTQG